MRNANRRFLALVLLLWGCSAPFVAGQTAAPAASVLLDTSGVGSKTTQPFAATGAWQATYTFDCRAFDPQGGGDFSFGVFSGTKPISMGVDTTGVQGGDTDYEHATGSLYLKVISECAWHIVIKG